MRLIKERTGDGRKRAMANGVKFGRLLSTLLAAIAEFERELIRERINAPRLSGGDSLGWR